MFKGGSNGDIETKPSFLQRYRILILILAGLLITSLTVIATQIVIHYQAEAKVAASRKLISSLKKEALLAQADDQLDKAEDLYSKALSEAIDSKLRMDGIELISRIVQIKIKKGQLGETKDLVQAAVLAASKLQNTPEADSSLPIWLDDMANAFYSRGENSTREDVKEFCLERYAEIKLAVYDHYDSIPASRICLLVTRLQNSGRPIEALPYEEKLCDYFARTKSKEPGFIATGHFVLGMTYLSAHKPADAEVAFKKWHDLHIKLGTEPGIIEGSFNQALGNVRIEEGNLETAKDLYRRALILDKHYHNGNSDVTVGREETTLALLEQRTGNTSRAIQLFEEALDCFDKCPIPKVIEGQEFAHLDGPFYSSQLFCINHLTQTAAKNRDSSLERSLKTRAEKIYAQNPYLLTYKNRDLKDFENFYIIRGYLPYPVDILPTRVKFAF